MATRRDDDDDRMAPTVFGILGGMLLLVILGHTAGSYVARPPVSAEPAPQAKAVAPAAKPADKNVSAAAPPVQPADVKPAASTAKLSIPGGQELSVATSGVESKLVAFITNPDATIDKATWFDFDRLNFETGSAKLTADSRQQVENIAAILKAYPAVAIKVGGYTDNVGNADANIKLSNARAAAVVEALTGVGIAADRLQSEGYGDQHAIADNATPEGRAKNRRTSISVRAK